LAFDDWDLEYYTKLFQTQIGRNPSTVECFDLAQSNRYLVPTVRSRGYVFYMMNCVP